MTSPVAPLLSSPPVDSRSRARTLLMGLQDSICSSLAAFDGEGQFQEESWVRPEGGGGRSRVMKAGRIFERSAVKEALFDVTLEGIGIGERCICHTGYRAAIMHQLTHIAAALPHRGKPLSRN